MFGRVVEPRSNSSGPLRMIIEKCIAARLPARPATASTSRSLTRRIIPVVCTDWLAPTACTES